MRVRWLRGFLWVAGFGCLWLNVCDDPPLATDVYLADVTSSAATVAKITAVPSRVECTVRDSSGALVRVVGGPANRRRHALRVEGLEAGREYTYSVTVDGGSAEGGRFRTVSTDDAEVVRFAFLGDSGKQPWWVWLQRNPAMHLPSRWGWFPCAPEVSGIGAAVAGYRPDFVLHLGDVVYPRGWNAHYSSGYFRPFGEAMRNAPFYAVLGNHDVMDCDGVQILANLCLPASEPTGDGRFFSVARGPVRVIGLDCNIDRTSSTFDATHPGAAFLAKELATRTEPWIVVATHFPMRTQSRQTYDRADLLLHMLPMLEEQGVSLYLSGHDHCYQRFGGSGDTEAVPLVVSGGGGKDLYAVRPSSRAAKLASVHHWCSVEAREGRLTVQANGLDGAVVDRFVLELPMGPALAAIRVRNVARAERIDRLRGR